MRGTATATVKNDKTAQLDRLIKDLGKLEVYVGIPEEDSSRPEKDGINNAELAYIHTHGVRQVSMRADMSGDIASGTPYSKAYEMYIHANGSPLWQSPPRPIIEPAIQKHKEPIAKELAAAGKALLDGNDQLARRQMEAAGMLGQNVSRAWFTDPENGWPENSPTTIERKGSDRPLIDTGELRKSITYVVRDKNA